MLGGAGSPGGDELLTVTVVRDEHGYGMKVSGDNPVYVQSVKEHGAAWRAGLRSGDRILRVDNVAVHHHTHQQVVHMIRANPTTVLTVQQNTSRLKTPITAPVPVNSEKQRQLEVSKVQTMRLMLEEEQNYIKDLRNELSKVPDVRKQQKLEAAESRCSHLQHEIDTITAAQPGAPFLAALISSSRGKHASSPPPNNSTGFLSGLPRSLSNLTGQSLRSIRQARQNNAKTQQENQPPLVRQNSDESNNKRRHVHNNTVPMVPTTCLDNVTPPPLPPRTERPKRNPLSPTLSPPLNPLAKPKPCSSASPIHNQYYKGRYYPDKFPMHQSMPGYDQKKLRKSSHSLDGELDGPQPNSIAMQMSYPLVNAPPPPLQTDNRGNVPVLHVRSQSSPEHLDHDMMRSTSLSKEREAAPRATPPPGTPPPPYAHNTQPCADPQRAIISMEEDDSPASDNSIYSGLFSNLRSVRESKARTAVLINWLLGERRCACASLLLVITDGYRAAAAPAATLRRWAYEIQSTFLMPHAVLQLNGVDENMANEIEHVLVNEYEKEELLRNVFRKARQKAKEELSQQLTEFQVKRQLGLGALYGPEDSLIEKCDVDKAQEVVVVERLLCARLSSLSALRAGGCASSPGPPSADAHHALLAALVAAALTLHARPAAVAAAAGGSRASFLQRDKTYKQRTKQLAKQHPQPFIVRGHHLQLQAMTSVGHCHHCDNVIWGLAPQAYVCTDCKLRVHGRCARAVEEGCVGGDDSHNNRISRLIDRIQPHAYQDSSEKKSRKSSGASHFLNMERSFRKMEDEQPWDQTLTPATAQGEPRREGSTDEPTPPEADADHSDSVTKETQDKETHSWRSPSATATRGVNRAESCRERDAPRRGKHRNASDPNRLTAHNNHDLEPGAVTAPSGSSSSSSLSSRSNESNTATIGADQQASQSDWSEEDEPLAAQWADSLPSHVLDSLLLSSRLRKRQEVIHELIVSEGSHVRWLKVLGGVFLRPLEAQTSLLPAEELRALFPNLPAVREKHAKLYAELRQVRADADNHVVRIRPVADAMLATLGEAGYASCLSRFCRGQRMSLEALRERRRKSKELHQFLAAREQLPLCGRLQLRDLLACVWQRLTKYQLLLESILKTVSDNEAESEADGETEEDIHRLKRALDTAKDVLQSVDHAIRTAENEHRLRTIQSKLEVRISIVGAEWEEARRLDLTARRLRMEADLSIRNDNKKINVLALMLEDCLVLLQREGDKFVLKPIAQPSQQSHLSPLIKWDKVLFRPNAAVRNTFFLMNINGVQMHELSANTNNEYSTWVKHIQELPLAKPELKPSLTPSHQASRSTDDSGINVSRNPSDASEKSNSLAGEDESERDRASTERSSAERERETEDKRSVDREERRSEDKEEAPEREEKHKPRRPTVGRISTHVSLSPAPLEAGALTVTAPAADTRAARAETAYTYQEHLRRLDESIARSLAAKSAIVSKLLGLPADSFAQMADLAVAETMGQIDVCGELGLPGTRAEEPAPEGAPDMHQLLLAAHAQANQLVESLSSALSVEEGAAVAARATRGRCDRCTRRRDTQKEDATEPCPESAESPARGAGAGGAGGAGDAARLEDDTFEALESVRGALVARRTAGLGAGVALAVGRALSALPAHLARAQLLRQEVAALRDDNDRLRDLLRQGYSTTEEIHFPKEGGDQTIQDQPSNGG